MKQYFLALIAFSFLLTACEKAAEPPVNLNAVGTWKLDKVIPSKLTGAFTSLNNKELDPLQYFGFSSVFTLNSDRSFTNKETDNGATATYTGTWSISDKTLTLTYSDKSVEEYTFDELNKKIVYDDTSTTLTLTNPISKRDEDVVCDAQYVYLKQ